MSTLIVNVNGNVNVFVFANPKIRFKAENKIKNYVNDNDKFNIDDIAYLLDEEFNYVEYTDCEVMFLESN